MRITHYDENGQIAEVEEVDDPPAPDPTPNEVAAAEVVAAVEAASDWDEAKPLILEALTLLTPGGNPT